MELGSTFTSGPWPVNPPKRYAVANVHKNYSAFLFEKNEGGNVDLTRSKDGTRIHPVQIRQGRIAVEVGK
jgi:hypothetical protein